MRFSSQLYGIYISGAGTITVPGPGGKPVQVPQAMVAQAQLGMLQPSADGTVTIQGSDGRPVKIPQAALANAPSALPHMPGGNGTIITEIQIRANVHNSPRIVNRNKKSKAKLSSRKTSFDTKQILIIR